MTSRLLLAFSMFVCGAAPAIAANQIVVRSAGPSAKAYPVGRQLPSGSKVSLRIGDSLTVLGPSKALVLQGPGTFEVAASQETDAFSRTRFSARRGPPVPRGPWAVDVAHSGKVCSTAKEKLSLWRSAGDSQWSVTISGADVSPVTLQWPAGTQVLDWPAELPLKDGFTYVINVPGRVRPAEWTVAAIGPWSIDQAAAAELLLKHGCRQQLDQLVEAALWKG